MIEMLILFQVPSSFTSFTTCHCLQGNPRFGEIIHDDDVLGKSGTCSCVALACIFNYWDWEKANDIVVFGEGSECIEPQLDNHTLFQND